MSIFDLLFILVFLVALALVGRILYVLAKRGSRKALGPAKILSALALVYFGALTAVSLATPRKLIPMGEDQCFDDWCIQAERLSVSKTIGSGADTATAKGLFYIVTLKVSSRARGIIQRARDADVIAIDEQDRTYLRSPEGQRAFDAVNGKAIPMTSLIGPGQSFTTTVLFDVPANAAQIGLEVEHGVWPGRLIIGDSKSFFHQPTLIMLRTS